MVARWIYLQPRGGTQWVARRTPLNPDGFQPAPFAEDDGPLWMQAGDKAVGVAGRIVGEFFNPTN